MGNVLTEEHECQPYLTRWIPVGKREPTGNLGWMYVRMRLDHLLPLSDYLPANMAAIAMIVPGGMCTIKIRLLKYLTLLSTCSCYATAVLISLTHMTCILLLFLCAGVWTSIARVLHWQLGRCRVLLVWFSVQDPFPRRRHDHCSMEFTLN